MSEWITNRRPTKEDADCTGFVWITTEYGVVLREPWKTVRDRPWMPITPPEPYVEPPKRYKLMYRSTTRQYYIQDTESCDKRFVASCIPTREKADRISNIFEDQNSMSEWITDRKPTEKDGPMVYNSQGGVWHYTYIMNGDPWKPIPECEPYVKPKRWRLVHPCVEGCWKLKDADGNEVRLNFLRADEIHEEAAKEIAAIYERVKP